MSNYTKTTDFEAKDSLPTGDSGKIIRGSEFETEFDAISTAIATKADTAGPTFTGTLTFETISDGTIGVTAFVDEDDMASDSATLVPTQQSVKAYVDAQVTAQDLDFQADSGGALSIDLDSESLTFTGGTGIDTSGSGNAVTFAIDSTVATLTGTQTLTNKTLTSPDVNTPDIDGGTIDGTVIGGTTAAAGSFTTVSATGNITVDGTVDGRDVATDGTKLDTVETNADVTDTANVTAAGALMDSELTSEASVKALNQGVATTDSPTFAGVTVNGTVEFDGLSGTGAVSVTDILDQDDMSSNSATALATQQSIKAYVDSQVGANNELSEVLSNGNTTGGTDISVSSGDDITFADSSKAIFGASSDLQIYHDGSGSFVDDQGTGGLILRGTNLFLRSSANENYLGAVADGAVTLYHDNSSKLETTSTGIDVTGVITTDGMTTSADINFGDNDKAVFGAGSDLQIYHDGSTSIITDQGTGFLALRGDGNVSLQNAAGTENKLVASTDGAVTVYYDNTARLATTSTGIDVTGSVVSDGATVAGTLELDSNNFDHTAATPQYNMIESDVTGKNTQILQSTGLFRIRTVDDSLANPVERLRIDHDTGDISFFGSVAGQRKFYWDSSADALGIGTVSPSTALEVVGTITSTGIDVTGTVTADGLTVDGDPALNGNVTITNTGTGAAAGPYLTLDRNSSSPADSDLLGILSFRGRDDGANATDYGTIAGKIADVTGGTEDGVMLFNVISGGSSRDVLTLSHNESVFNNGSADQDFRVESNDATHMLFVNAGANRVGIGESSPQYPLHVTSSGTTLTRLESTDAGTGYGPYLDIRRTSSSPVDGDGLGIIVFTGQDSGGNGTTYAQIRAEATDVTDTTEDGLLSIRTMTGGSDTARININSTETNLNEQGSDLDFRVESDGKTHMLFVDAGNDRVGVGGTPSSTFHVQSGTENNVATFTSTDSTATIMMQDNTGNAQFGVSGSTARISPNSSYAVLEASQSSVVINNASQDTDFRVESDASANMLVVDAAENKVGINRTPNISNSKLEVGGADNVPIFNVEASGYTGGLGIGAAGLQLFHGSSSKVLIASGGMVINEDSADFDFRVESNNQTNMLFVDAGNDRVGIVESAPESQLHIKQTADIGTGDTMGLMIESGTSTQRYMLQTGRTGVSNAYFNLRDVSNSRDIWSVIDTDGTFQGHTPFQWNNAAVFNDGSQDYDFRVESAGNENMLFVDASMNAVGIGHNTPLVPFHVKSTGSGEIVRIESTNADASQGPILALYRNSSSPADSDGIGRINFLGEDSAGNQTTYNYINATITDVSNGTEDSKISLGVLAGGAARSAFILDGGTGATFNEDGIAAHDLRVEGDSQSHLLFADAGADAVMVGLSASPTANEGGIYIDADGFIKSSRNGVSTKTHYQFLNDNGVVGSIATNASTTTYNTSSDARLKENIADADDAGELIDAIQVRQFDWIADGEHQRYGMVAQELNTVAPEAVSEGETEEDMMAVDYSKLVPMLIKEIQSLRARVAQLESN